MKVRLQVEYVSYEGRNDAKNYVELEKSIELPFVPMPGLKIYLRDIDEEHPDNEKWETILDASNGVFHTGIFELSSVLFVLETGEFRVKSYSTGGFSNTPEAIELLTQHLVTGYGFERREEFD